MLKISKNTYSPGSPGPQSEKLFWTYFLIEDSQKKILIFIHQKKNRFFHFFIWKNWWLPKKTINNPGVMSDLVRSFLKCSSHLTFKTFKKKVRTKSDITFIGHNFFVSNNNFFTYWSVPFHFSHQKLLRDIIVLKIIKKNFDFFIGNESFWS